MKRVGSTDYATTIGSQHRIVRIGWSWILLATNQTLSVTGSGLPTNVRRRLPTCDSTALANSLGVSADSLRQLRVGWSSEHAAYTFPMCDAVGRVLGVRLRGSDGHKWSVRGGQEGLFLPRTGETANSGMLLVCEGPTDAAALIDLGFYTIGRPSCTGGVRLIVELVQSLRPDCVTILADADAPGIRGANNLAVLLTAYVPSVRVVIPPPGIKDARQWKRRGATHGDVLRRIEMVEPRRLGIVVKGGVR